MAEAFYTGFHDALVQNAAGVMKDEVTIFDFINILPQIRAGLEWLRQDFDAKVSRESESIKEYCSNAIEEVHKCFAQYTQVIEQMEAYSNRLDKLLLEAEVKRIGDIFNRLNVAFLFYRNEAFIARGPSSHGGVNYLINIIDRIMGGEDGWDELGRAIYLEHQASEQASALIEAAEQNVFSGGMNTFFTSYREILSHIQYALDSRDAASLAPLRENMAAWGEYYKKYDIHFLLRAHSSTPTSLPLANLVIYHGQQIAAGAGDMAIFQYFLNELKQLYEKVRYRYDEVSTRQKPTSVIEAEESELLDRTLKNIARAVVGFEIFIQTSEEKHFAHSERILTSSAEAFYNSIYRLQVMAEDSGKVTCFQCGYKNVAGEVSCRNCRGLLPQVEGRKMESTVDAILDEGIELPEEESGPRMTVYVNSLFQAASALAQQKISSQDFETVLGEMDARLKEVQKRVKEVPPVTTEMIKAMGKRKSEVMHALLTEASAAYGEGLQAFSQGIALFREFGSSLSTQKLENGKELIWSGIKKLQEAQDLIKKEFKVEGAE